jgi:hypothetical protein
MCVLVPIRTRVETAAAAALTVVSVYSPIFLLLTIRQV